ncbi:hypothetical protein MRX96_035681 [Rhipicephalus microplus]
MDGAVRVNSRRYTKARTAGPPQSAWTANRGSGGSQGGVRRRRPCKDFRWASDFAASSRSGSLETIFLGRGAGARKKTQRRLPCDKARKGGAAQTSGHLDAAAVEDDNVGVIQTALSSTRASAKQHKKTAIEARKRKSSTILSIVRCEKGTERAWEACVDLWACMGARTLSIEAGLSLPIYIESGGDTRSVSPRGENYVVEE